MLFYGWGGDAQVFPMPDGRTVRCEYRYVTLFFIFKFVYKQTWHIIEQQAPAPLGSATPPPPPPSPREVTRDDLKALYTPDDPPGLGLWTRFGLAVPLAGLGVFIAMIVLSNSTLVDDLEAGDCFIETDEQQITSVDTPDCSEPHDAQFVASLDLVGAPDSYPGIASTYWDTVFEECATAADAAIIRFDELPDSTQLAFLTPNREDWEDGDHYALCYIYSPDGLEGSFVRSTGA